MKPSEPLGPLDPSRHDLPMQTADDVELSQYVDFIWGARWYVAAFVVAMVLLGGAYALLAEPIYEADVLIQVEASADSTQNLLGELSSVFDIKTQAKTEIEILRSRMVVSRAVDALHLYIAARPRYFPLIGRFIAAHSTGLSAPGLFGFGGFVWGRERIAVEAFEVPETLYEKRFDLTYMGAGRYRLSSPIEDRTFDGHVGRAERFAFEDGVVVLDVTAIEAKAGARFVLKRASRLETIDKLQTELNVLETTKDSSVIAASLKCADPQRCRDTMHEIGDAYVSQNIQRKAAEAAKSVAFLDRQLPDLRRQLERAEEKYTRFRDAHNSFDLNAEAQQLLAQSADAQTKLVDLRVQRELLLTRFGARNASVVALDEQMRTLTNTADGFARSIRALPDVEQQAVGLMRDVQVDTQLYTDLLNTSEQLKIVAAGKVGSVRLVDDAVLPETPVQPKPLLVLALSLGGGVILGILAAYVRGSLFDGVADPHDIETRLGINVFATVPFSVTQETMMRDAARGRQPLALLARKHSHEPAVESLRSLRTALQFAMLGTKSNVVVFTGPTPGIGKSFVSANFAEVLAAAGKHVLLIDADMRRGSLHAYCGVSRDVGLSDLIAGTKTVEQVTHRAIGSGFDFVSSGAFPPNPSELLQSDAFRGHLAMFRERYDIVLIDTPPALLVSDAQAVGACAGVLFLVARYQLTKLGELEEATKRLAAAGAGVKGVLFNGMKLGSGRYRYGSKNGRYRHAAYGYYVRQDPD